MTWRTFWFLECGASFTSKLEGMFRDMELSKDVMVQFKQVSICMVIHNFTFILDQIRMHTISYTKLFPSIFRTFLSLFLSFG